MNPLASWRALLDRHPFAKDVVWGFFEFGLTLLVCIWITPSIHEWVHLNVTQYFGGDGYIIKTVFGAGVVWTTQPDYPQLVAFAGGLGVAIIFSLLALRDFHDDIEQAAGYIPVICSQAAYGILEGFFIFKVSSSVFRDYAQKALAIGWTIGLLIAIIMLLVWLVRLSAKYDKSII